MSAAAKTSMAVAVTLTTIIVCFLGIRAELRQAKRLEAARGVYPVQPKAGTEAAPEPALARD